MKAAIYCRLSKEDEIKDKKEDISESIQNQKLLLMEFAKTHGYEIKEYYCDEHYSGLDPERPEFKRMLEDAKNHKFEIILCKNQSRFTRDMELVERYIHGYFPIWGIRFIGVVDHIDTEILGNKKARQIHGLINEWYCEDLSENIKSVLHTKMENGQYIGTFAPYGYQKDHADHHHLIVDREKANIVKKIYALFLEGRTVTEIAAWLLEEKIPTPTNREKWSKSTIRNILKNPVYTGKMVQGKTSKISYKSKKQIKNKKENWIVVEKTHEAIIEEEKFQRVQQNLGTRKEKQDFKRDPIGKLCIDKKIICRECTSFMIEKRGSKTHRYLYCRRYLDTKGKECTKHSMNVKRLEEIIKQKADEMGLGNDLDVVWADRIKRIEIGEIRIGEIGKEESSVKIIFKGCYQG